MLLPSFVQLEPVGQCNLRCRMCPIQFRRDGPPYGPPALMRFELFASLLEQFPELRELHLQGLGEPMMHPRFIDMISHAVARGVTVSVNSNCTLLSRARAERLVDSGLDTLHVSIDGARASTYERIREGGTFFRVLRGVLWVQQAKRRRGSSLKLRLVTVAMRDNLEELPDIVRLAARLEIPTMFVQHLCHDFGEESLPAHYAPMREYVNAQTLVGEDESRVARVFALAREAAAETGVDLRLPALKLREHAPDTPGRDRCDWPWHGAYVSYDGQAMPCCMIATPDRASFGSVAERGVDAVWNGADYSAFRAALGSATPPAVCASCSIYRGTF